MSNLRQADGPPRAFAAAGQPPDRDHVWLDAPAVAALTGMSKAWVKARARDGRILAKKTSGKWWVCRDHADVLAAARDVKKLGG